METADPFLLLVTPTATPVKRAGRVEVSGKRVWPSVTRKMKLPPCGVGVKAGNRAIGH